MASKRDSAFQAHGPQNRQSLHWAWNDRSESREPPFQHLGKWTLQIKGRILTDQHDLVHQFYTMRDFHCDGMTTTEQIIACINLATEGFFPYESEFAQSCPTPCDPMNCSPPSSSIHEIFQARALEWGAISFSKRSSWPRDHTRVSCIAGRRFSIWAIHVNINLLFRPCK